MTWLPRPPAPTTATDAAAIFLCPSVPNRAIWRSNLPVIAVPFERGHTSGQEDPAFDLHRTQASRGIRVGEPGKSVESTTRYDNRCVRSSLQPPPHMGHDFLESRPVAR